ncbi:MAG: rhomboid family intramembrane serine protease [Oscillospiraceae bacterium]
MKAKKISYNSPVILTFTFISLAALIVNYITGGVSNMMFFCVYRDSLLNPLFYLRLFTHVIGHADISHFIGNFTLILIIGPILEEKYGSKTLLILMALTAFITGLINVIFFTTGLLGASGIVFMLIILASFTNKESGKIPLTFILVAVIYVGGEIIDALLVSDNISQMAHIIGGICGAAAGHFLGGTKAK